MIIFAQPPLPSPTPAFPLTLPASSSSNQGDGEEGISGIDFEPYSFLNASTAIPIGSLAALGVANLTAVAPAGNLTDYILSFAPDGAHFQVSSSRMLCCLFSGPAFVVGPHRVSDPL